jgi:hypothetical protein
MTEVIQGEFAYPFEVDLKEPRPINVSGTAVIKYEAERYSKEDGWFIEDISVSEMTIDEAYNEEGDATGVGSDEVLILANYISTQSYDDLVYRAIEDSHERSFYG